MRKSAVETSQPRASFVNCEGLQSNRKQYYDYIASNKQKSKQPVWTKAIL